MLKKSHWILAVLFSLSSYSYADYTGNFTGKWSGSLSESISGLVPSAIVGVSITVDEIIISENGTISGTAYDPIVGNKATIGGTIDHDGKFKLHSSDAADQCQYSGQAIFKSGKVVFSGGGICDRKQADDGSLELYKIMSATLDKVQ